MGRKWQQKNRQRQGNDYFQAEEDWWTPSNEYAERQGDFLCESHTATHNLNPNGRRRSNQRRSFLSPSPHARHSNHGSTQSDQPHNVPRNMSYPVNHKIQQLHFDLFLRKSKKFKEFLLNSIDEKVHQIHQWYPDEISSKELGDDEMEWQPESEILIPQPSGDVSYIWDQKCTDSPSVRDCRGKRDEDGARGKKRTASDTSLVVETKFGDFTWACRGFERPMEEVFCGDRNTGTGGALVTPA
ncbi:hypothetical protein B7494_g3035 [Chlorociboria aeruginascens]|nr:hypothetical protein B7494_g3035 [Chlorociboria aeruginascens]